MKAQAASPTFTSVYAALVAIVNTKFPAVGELVLSRLVVQFRKSFKRNDKVRPCSTKSRASICSFFLSWFSHFSYPLFFSFSNFLLSTWSRHRP
jgi:hypothetical protein